jgi:hypothetical protein
MSGLAQQYAAANSYLQADVGNIRRIVELEGQHLGNGSYKRLARAFPARKREIARREQELIRWGKVAARVLLPEDASEKAAQLTLSLSGAQHRLLRRSDTFSITSGTVLPDEKMCIVNNCVAAEAVRADLQQAADLFKTWRGRIDGVLEDLHSIRSFCGVQVARSLRPGKEARRTTSIFGHGQNGRLKEVEVTLEDAADLLGLGLGEMKRIGS